MTPLVADPSAIEGWYPGDLVDEVETALTHYETGVDELLAIGDRGDFMALGPEALIGLIREHERHRNRLAAIDHLLIEAIREEALWEHTSARNESGVLQEVLRLSPGAAKARIRDADRLGRRSGDAADILPPLLPTTALAQRHGALTVEQVHVIGAALDSVDQVPGIHPDDVAKAEETLVEYASGMQPSELRTIGLKIVDVLDPDGRLPLDRLTQARRGVTIGDTRPDGTAPISGSLTPALRAKLFTVLNPMAAPAPTDADGPDLRTGPQRNHDGLEQLCDLLLRSGELPASGGVPTTLIVTVSAETLQRAAEAIGGDLSAPIGRQVAATTADGQILTLAELVRIAEQASIIPVYLDTVGGIVGFGRSRRLASPGQTQALIARDGGCSFPGCSAPPQWCERHHVLPWLLGGPTDLDNLTLVCGYHHREFRQRGWACRMAAGLPEWIPPVWVDPAQQPLMNDRLIERDLRAHAHART